MDKRLLVVDDSEDVAALIEAHFSALGYYVDTVGSGRTALEYLGHGFEGVVLLDFKLPDVEGFVLLEQILDTVQDCKVIMITAHGDIGMAMEAVNSKGAFYVHSKAEESFKDRLAATVVRAFEALALERTVKTLQGQMESQYSFSSIVTQSRQMQVIFRMLEKVVESKIAVLIQGESGTGKELIARAIHYNGPRHKEPFVAINCAGIPDTLLESELFGYEKGAFTGAYSRKTGKFEAAHRGTLFLDEIGEMNLPLQAKILRILQEKSFERLGGNESVEVDVRIISATNRDLEKDVRDGRFREDLYYRLAVFPIVVPPLRDRREDIPILAQHFTLKFAAEENKPILGLSQRALDRLSAFDFPGNVRQLENAISHAVVVCNSAYLDVNDLPPYLRRTARPAIGAFTVGEAPPFSPDGSAEFMSLSTIEEMAIKNAIQACNGNMSRAARMLGISRATIYRKYKGKEESQ
jgi:DNA-binding NtrC family response regulator